MFALASCEDSDYTSPSNRILEENDSLISIYLKNNSITEYETLRKGLYVQVLDTLVSETRESIDEGDTLGISYKIFDIKGNLVSANTKPDGEKDVLPIIFKNGRIYPSAIYAGINNRKKGDKIRIMAASSYAYADLGFSINGKEIEINQPVVIELELNEISVDEINTLDDRLAKEEFDEVVKDPKFTYLPFSEASRIKGFRIFEGAEKEDKVKTGSKVATTYEGKLLNGLTFDKTTNDTTAVSDTTQRVIYQYYKFDFNTGNVIKGWDIAFKEMNVGDSAVVIIPSSLAYGADERRTPGLQLIPNDTTLFSKLVNRGIANGTQIISPFSVLKFNMKFIAKEQAAVDTVRAEIIKK